MITICEWANPPGKIGHVSQTVQHAPLFRSKNLDKPKQRTEMRYLTIKRLPENKEYIYPSTLTNCRSFDLSYYTCQKSVFPYSSWVKMLR